MCHKVLIEILLNIPFIPDHYGLPNIISDWLIAWKTKTKTKKTKNKTKHTPTFDKPIMIGL